MFITSNPASKVLAAASILLVSWGCLAQDAQTASNAGQSNPPAQQETQAPNQPVQQQAPAPGRYIVVPAGTRISLVVARPVRIKHAREGDSIYLQTAFPVSAGSKMVIPPATYVQGVIAEVTHRDTTRRVLEFRMGSASFIFNSGYSAAVSGTVDVASTVAKLVKPKPGANPSGSVPVNAAVGTVAPPTLPPLPPLPDIGKTARNMMIGMGVAAAVGITVVALVAANGPGPLMHTGTPLEMVLMQPLVLDADEVAAAIQQYSGQPPVLPQQPVEMGTCYEPGSPGTPDVVIPGSAPIVIPGVPATENSPGTPDTVIPGTPDQVIKGMPETPGRYYPCPR